MARHLLLGFRVGLAFFANLHEDAAEFILSGASAARADPVFALGGRDGAAFAEAPEIIVTHVSVDEFGILRGEQYVSRVRPGELGPLDLQHDGRFDILPVGPNPIGRDAFAKRPCFPRSAIPADERNAIGTVEDLRRLNCRGCRVILVAFEEEAAPIEQTEGSIPPCE